MRKGFRTIVAFLQPLSAPLGMSSLPGCRECVQEGLVRLGCGTVLANLFSGASRFEDVRGSRAGFWHRLGVGRMRRQSEREAAHQKWGLEPREQRLFLRVCKRVEDGLSERV